MANHNKFSINPDLPVPGAKREAIDASQEQESQTHNPAAENVAQAKARLESLEDRGAELRTRATEKIKGFGRGALGALDRTIGRAASGVETMRGKITDAREYASNLRSAAEQRILQRQARKEQEFNNARSDEAEFLSHIQPGDADGFNSMPSSTPAERAGREQAKQDSIDAAHAEALDENTRYDRAYNAQKQRHDMGDTAAWDTATDNMNDTQRKGFEAANRDTLDAAHAEALEEHEHRERERIEQEDSEYDATYNEVEDFLQRYKGNKEANLTDILRELRLAFPSKREHLKAAADDAFAVFSGKKMKQAARAARIAKGKAQVAEIRQKSYEQVRDRSSEAYQSALKSSKKLGRSLVRFSKRTATAAKAGFTATRDTWNAAKAAATEAQPVTNE